MPNYKAPGFSCGGVLVSTGVNEYTVSEPRTLHRATTGKNNN